MRLLRCVLAVGVVVGVVISCQRCTVMAQSSNDFIGQLISLISYISR